MRYILGKLLGFVTGCFIFLFFFERLILSKTPPSDELAPGIVVLSAICFGIILSFIGASIQATLQKRFVK